MRIVIGSDHAGFALKSKMSDVVRALGHDILDVGAFNENPADYPDFAEIVAHAITEGQSDRGVLFDGSGVGMTVAANKIPGIRACVCHDTCSARQGVEYDDLNILVIGSRIVGEKLAEELVKSFLGAQFSGAARHLRRLGKIKALESRVFVEPAKT
ncbi:MAG TPA: RpiB/LacA/LacB family sugar-phosphate isomerase [Candidatus Acidoferrum sp.]|nr:RpiB/LacA/LacB family sugar-phosphate isomerase [Candidatus Acidoferrum sp.]